LSLNLLLYIRESNCLYSKGDS